MRRILAAAGAALLVGTSGVAQDGQKKSAAPTLPPVTAPSPTAADAKPGASQQAADNKSAKPRAPESTAITDADIRDWHAFAKRLQVMGEADLLPTASVWKGLSAGAKAAVKRLAHDAKLDPIDQRVVLNALNAWVDAKESTADAGLRAENVHDAELQALLKNSSRSPAETRRLNRLIVDAMFPLEVAVAPAPVSKGDGTTVAKGDAGVTSRYPPNRAAEVTLALSVPNLRGRINVFLPDDKTLTFQGDQPVEIKVPNDGALRYAITGDGYDRPFPREVTWDPDAVKDGVVEKTLPLIGSRRRP